MLHFVHHSREWSSPRPAPSAPLLPFRETPGNLAAQYVKGDAATATSQCYAPARSLLSFMPSDKPRKRTHLQLKEDKDARAVVFMLERVKGKSLDAIAKDYDCSRQTVHKYLERARREGLIVGEARSLIQTKLLPLTLAVYEAHLSEGNLEAAQDILFGLGILQRNSTIKHESAADETLDGFRETLLNARDKAIDVVSTPTPPVPPVDSPQGLLSPPEGLPVDVLGEPAIPHESILHPPGWRPRLPDQSDEDE